LAFPFVTLKRATTDESDPAAAVFSDYEYLGLTTVGTPPKNYKLYFKQLH
jgi:hypothetical protein